MSVDCAVENGTNLKQDLLQSARRRVSAILEFDNPVSPIPEQIRDPEEYRRLFGGIERLFVPYAGNDRYTAHGLLDFLYNLAEISPTQSGVIEKKQRYAFGGKVKIVSRQDPEFDLGETPEVPPQEQKKFLQDFLPLIEIYDNSGQRVSVRDLARYQLADDERCGNFYFEICMTQVRGVKTFKVYTHDPRFCTYVVTPKGAQRYIAVSPIWTLDYLLRHPPAVLPLYPTFEKEGGVQRTIVHVKNGNLAWYGRPGSVASVLDQFLEFQNADYKVKHTHTNFVGQALIEVEGAPGTPTIVNDVQARDQGFDDASVQFAHNFSNVASNPQRVLLMERPMGAKEAFVHEFKPNTQEQWFRFSGEDARDNILKSHGGFPKMLFLGEGASGFSTDMFLDQFEVYEATTNTDIQTEFAAAINDIIFKEAVKFFERPDMEDLGIKFTSPFEQLLKRRQDAADNNNNRVGGSEVQPGI